MEGDEREVLRMRLKGVELEELRKVDCGCWLKGLRKVTVMKVEFENGCWSGG